MDRYNISESLPKELAVCGVYMIQISWHLYVGSAENIRTRILGHRKALRSGNHIHLMQEAYNKYGEENVVATILEKCNKDNLLEREEFWINSLPTDMNRENHPTNHPIYKPWNHPGISKNVYRYNLDGSYIDSFPSVKEAQRVLKVKSAVLISAAANPDNTTFKSAYGYLWSYDKKDYLEPYVNHSKDSKKVSIIIKNIQTGEEYIFDSIAEATRTLFPDSKNFNSLCAIISSCANGKGKTIKKLYTARYKKD